MMARHPLPRGAQLFGKSAFVLARAWLIGFLLLTVAEGTPLAAPALGAAPGAEALFAAGTALSGTVVDEEGRPVHGARIVVTSFDGGERHVQNTMAIVGVF